MKVSIESVYDYSNQISNQILFVQSANGEES